MFSTNGLAKTLKTNRQTHLSLANRKRFGRPWGIGWWVSTTSMHAIIVSIYIAHRPRWCTTPRIQSVWIMFKCRGFYRHFVILHYTEAKWYEFQNMSGSVRTGYNRRDHVAVAGWPAQGKYISEGFDSWATKGVGVANMQDYGICKGILFQEHSSNECVLCGCSLWGNTACIKDPLTYFVVLLHTVPTLPNWTCFCSCVTL